MLRDVALSHLDIKQHLVVLVFIKLALAFLSVSDDLLVGFLFDQGLDFQLSLGLVRTLHLLGQVLLHDDLLDDVLL